MKRAKHNLSHYKLFTADMGLLYPIGLQEVIPGDTFQHSTSLLARVTPMVAPVMHPISVRIHHFFVPNRIIWDGWEDFITGGPDNNSTETIPTLQVDLSGDPKRYLFDYFGIPAIEGLEVNALPFRAYAKIFDEYYRDQDFEQPTDLDSQVVSRIAWGKDYFTTARPWEQKGDAVTIPIGESAPVISDGTPFTWSDGTDDLGVFGRPGPSGGWRIDGDEQPPWEQLVHGANTGLQADLSNAQAVNVNEFRRAFALQRYSEARARYGSRYTEYLRYLGIKPSDARLQRPEYLGGGKTNVSISEILQTAPDNENNAEYGVGDLYGHGIAALRSNKYRKFFEEHGYIVSCASIVPKSIYQDGVARHFLKRDKEDYYQRELVHIGQQPVYNNEVYASIADGSGIFGYQDRYDEYRTSFSQVTGEFRDQLNYWHLARKFEDTPVLNSSFTNCNPSKRIFAEQTQQSFWCAAQHRIVARRLVPRRSMSRII